MMLCDAFPNMLVISLPILEYLGCISFDFQTDFRPIMDICYTIMWYVIDISQLNSSNYHRSDDHFRK